MLKENLQFKNYCYFLKKKSTNFNVLFLAKKLIDLLQICLQEKKSALFTYNLLGKWVEYILSCKGLIKMTRLLFNRLLGLV